MTVSIKVDSKALKEVEKKLGEMGHKAPNAISSSLNRTITNISSNISKEVRVNYHIKAGDVKETLTTRKASRSSLSAEVKSSGSVIPLDRFKVSPKTVQPKRRRQLKVAVKKEGIKQIMGAFIADVHGIKVFKRESNKRLPIARLFGPSVPQMIGNKQVVEKINEEAVNTYSKRLEHEINRILQQLGAK